MTVVRVALAENPRAGLARAGGDAVRRAAENLLIPLLAVAAALALFGAFVSASRVNPLELYALMYRGAFGTERAGDAKQVEQHEKIKNSFHILIRVNQETPTAGNKIRKR